MPAGKHRLSSSDDRPSDLRWCHPLVHILDGIVCWTSNQVVAIGVIAMVFLTWFEAQTDEIWRIVIAPAMMVFGVALLFAFAGWIARSSH